MTRLLTIDFEASCLPRHGRSFPIEVALADRGGWSRSWLIRPHASWTGWTWTAEAEALHGLTLLTLHRDGMAAAQVVEELAEAARGHRILADSLLDITWFETLCAAAGMALGVRIEHVGALAEELAAHPDDLAAAFADADRQVPGRHRAAADALWLATLTGSLTDAAARRAADRPLFPWASASGTHGPQALPVIRSTARNTA